MTNEVPDVLAGRYEVGPLLGKGATARVYRAVDRELGRAVAVKVYDRHAVAVEQLRRAREKALLASVHHPGVVALFDSGTEGERPYLVMQLVDGENLAERLCAGPFTAAEVGELGVRLAHALAHVHARGIVHRDLKPANVLLGPDGPLITDFGIAHALDSTHLTGTGLVTGTAAYLAPEQILGEPAGPPADVYALGLILLECLTAQREFPGTLAESAMARLHRAPRIPGGTPDPLAHTLRRMTAREPGDRPDAELLPQLLREPADAVTAAVPPAAPRRRRVQAAAGVLVTAAATAVLAVVLGTPAAPGTSPARLPQAAPPATSAAVPPQVTSSPAPVAVPASARAEKPVTVGVVGPARTGPVQPEGGPGKPDGGPAAKQDGGPRRGPDALKDKGPGRTTGKR
ncbi:serine/threonine protein kinase [Amycolatopsis mediterranei S699]|uniref:non-specific serine/threonine protein kinase n=2 Tax=Amycolatopsis mediterranei TaxID=33910 RepID=A0A0H3D2R6_AMYMU|nr:serine/threonine-protein kinase [Amycolatopsis mediterranei]ADJ44940.1 serine/threonine protein kinase [Amycolatopsis mediterranei U32]AEK41690.1 serine/threonine protein kinase [Amycolatopsis mediterranei S699]AFO76651.1 serine/threonine protein kinase [Amycolatopsis mediterranei S699]AGT83780.1 serine/threonine protein kinase [Amycolatopsis mediterranei RB]KDO07235.1 serine/threonine protein kinase [Amycolatopsis mediterranei]